MKQLVTDLDCYMMVYIYIYADADMLFWILGCWLAHHWLLANLC